MVPDRAQGQAGWSGASEERVEAIGCSASWRRRSCWSWSAHDATRHAVAHDDAARNATWHATYDAARYATNDVARNVANDAARYATRNVANDAARHAAAYDATRHAATHDDAARHVIANDATRNAAAHDAARHAAANDDVARHVAAHDDAATRHATRWLRYGWTARDCRSHLWWPQGSQEEAQEVQAQEV